MIVAIHQPNYIPYMGFFDKMLKADIFVLYDDAQFNKGDFQHRNKIRIFHGWKWLTVPVEKKPIPIKEIKINNQILMKDSEWSKAHFREIRDNYKDTPYFDTYENEIEDIYATEYTNLVDLNLKLIQFFRRAFDINTKLIFSSEIGSTSKSTERLVEIVETLGGDVYLSGLKGHDYLDVSQFEKNGINIEFQNFQHPIYKQRYKDFIPNMSAFDVLFNVGRLVER